jgi:hypothetical protein
VPCRAQVLPASSRFSGMAPQLTAAIRSFQLTPGPFRPFTDFPTATLASTRTAEKQRGAFASERHPLPEAEVLLIGQKPNALPKSGRESGLRSALALLGMSSRQLRRYKSCGKPAATRLQPQAEPAAAKISHVSSITCENLVTRHAQRRFSEGTPWTSHNRIEIIRKVWHQSMGRRSPTHD